MCLFCLLGLTTEGIYRLCGQQSVVTRLLTSLATGEIAHLDDRWRSNRCVIGNGGGSCTVVWCCIICVSFHI